MIAFLGRCATLALLCLAVAACGQTQRPKRTQAPPPPMAFRLADTDRNGQVSVQEWDTSSDRLFDRLDSDKSGYIEKRELRQGFEVIDRDGDRQIEPEEARGVVARADRDGDGQVSRAEFERNDWAEISSDLDRDGRISREEFRRSRRQDFDAADTDRDRNLRYVRGERVSQDGRVTMFRF